MGNDAYAWENHVGKGWRPVVKEAVAQVLAKGGGIRDVKEKFGGLRLYVSGGKEVQEVAREAERQCDILCENCGRPGSFRQGPWIKCLCDDCRTVDYGESAAIRGARMTPEGTAETFRSKLNGGPDARDAAIAEIASAIREAVDCEREARAQLADRGAQQEEFARLPHQGDYVTSVSRQCMAEELAEAIRSRSEKPAITPKESA